MRICVGSGNPVKRRAVESVLATGDDGFGAGATVESAAVESGVSEQPRGHVETIRGAETRARRALAAVPDDGDEYDLGVGIEGGVADFLPNPAARRELDDGRADAGADGTDGGAGGTYLVMWAAVTDDDRIGRGAGPSIRLPPTVERRVDEGEELGPVMDDVLGENDVAKREGAAGAFTNGRVDRETALATAVAGALGPFVSPLY